MVSTHLKNISQIRSSPRVGVKIKNIWNHHLATVVFSYYHSPNCTENFSEKLPNPQTTFKIPFKKTPPRRSMFRNQPLSTHFQGGFYRGQFWTVFGGVESSQSSHHVFFEEKINGSVSSFWSAVGKYAYVYIMNKEKHVVFQWEKSPVAHKWSLQVFCNFSDSFSKIMTLR